MATEHETIFLANASQTQLAAIGDALQYVLEIAEKIVSDRQVEDHIGMVRKLQSALWERARSAVIKAVDGLYHTGQVAISAASAALTDAVILEVKIDIFLAL